MSLGRGLRKGVRAGVTCDAKACGLGVTHADSMHPDVIQDGLQI